MTARFLIVVFALCVIGCERGDQRLTVFAASSLTDAMESLASLHEEQNPGIDVEFNFAGSQALRTQIEHGAPADVFASANSEHVRALHEERLVVEPGSLVCNELAIAVPRTSELQSFRDITTAESLVVGDSNVPVGRYAERLLERSAERWGDDFRRQVEGSVVSRESNVRLALARVALGEADAAIVYRSDAMAAGEEVRFIEIPAELNVQANYRTAPTTDAEDSDEAEAWVRFTQSESARRVFESHGFIACDQEE